MTSASPSLRFSRRQMLALMAAGTGATAVGAAAFLGDDSPGSSSEPAGSDPAATSSTPSTSGASPSTTAAPMAESMVERSDRLLVVVEMLGGNDGLSTAVRYGSGAYHDLRDVTAIADADVLDIDGSIGLHPNLVELHERGVALVEGVGSTVPDGSHFEMQARWWAGNSAVAETSTGWIGRLADVLQDDSGRSTPATALTVGAGAHPIIRSANASTVSMPGPDALLAVSGATEQSDHMRWMFQQSLREFADAGSRISVPMGATLDFADRMLAQGFDPTADDRLGYDGEFGESLRFAAAILAGGVGVRVIHVTTTGDYDTHQNHAYRHPLLMTELDTNLGAFHRDIDARGLGDRVMVMTASEFGRTPRENSSGGLDHGTSSTMLLSGPGTTGRFGEPATLTDLDRNDDLKANVAFESYLGGVVEGWLGVPSSELFDGSFTPLQLF